MIPRLPILGFAAALLGAAGLTGCGSSDNGDTSQAVKDVQSASSQGGAAPSPDLPAPMTGAPPRDGGKAGKFSPAAAGG